ncbi:hypothetical protein DPMN_120273 [Dreissena polymorpha]|uniref:Uncharacterized protein n=1 Tax=Dreissena polymorpha TaxID=45954 RepID=A0A9D4GR90_DREPO|nr:hypothetical protein DPMN_120273 [Dreissena polymorpha]
MCQYQTDNISRYQCNDILKRNVSTNEITSSRDIYQSNDISRDSYQCYDISRGSVSTNEIASSRDSVSTNAMTSSRESVSTNAMTSSRDSVSSNIMTSIRNSVSTKVMTSSRFSYQCNDSIKKTVPYLYSDIHKGRYIVNTYSMASSSRNGNTYEMTADRGSEDINHKRQCQYLYIPIQSLSRNYLYSDIRERQL